MLIKTNEELRKILGGAISMSLAGESETTEQNDRILTYVELAEDKYLKKAVGEELMQKLQTDYDANVTEAAHVKLFRKVQRALACYTYYEYLAVAIGQDGDNGLQEEEKDKQPRMWVVLDRRNSTAENASFYIEETLALLFKEKTAYPEFRASEVWAGTYSLLINSGKVLGEAVPSTGGSYRLFISIWQYLKNAEREELIQVMGAGTYEYLKDKHKDETIEGLDVQLIEHARRLAGHAAYCDALPHLVVIQTTDSGLRVLSEFDGIRNRKAPDEKQIEKLQKSLEEKRNRYRAELKNFLDTNRESYPLYKEQMYRGGSQPAFLRAKDLNTIFPMNG